MKIKLSIITINYNNREGLKRTIDSVLSQTWQDFEWIIIDGGSTDGSKELIEQYQIHLSYWCSEPDGGIYNAMNKGINHVKGGYILFLNSGDYLYNNHVIDYFYSLNPAEDIVYGNLIKMTNPPIVDKCFHSDKITCFGLFRASVCHPASFIKKELFDKYGYYDESLRIVADWKFFFISIVINHCSVKYIDKNISCFDMSGISSQTQAKVKEEKMKVLREFLPEYVFDDYRFYFYENEIRKFKVTRMLYSALYRLSLFIDKYRK